MSDSIIWLCPNCPGNPEFDHKAMMEHLLSAHSIDHKKTPANRKLMLHAKLEGGALYQFEWWLNGLKFIQNCTHLRDPEPKPERPKPSLQRDLIPSPKREGQGEGKGTVKQPGMTAPQPANCLGDEDWMPFGKYGPKGAEPRKMKDIPPGYLDWLTGQDWLPKFPKVMNYIFWRRKAIDCEMQKGK